MSSNGLRFIGVTVLIAPWVTLVGRTNRIPPEEQAELLVLFVLLGLFCCYWILRFSFGESDRPVGVFVLAYVAILSEFLGGFAYTYWLMGGADGCFGEAISKVDATYFTITTFTTTGFGDMHVEGDVCRGIVTAQMLIGFVIISIGIGTAVGRLQVRQRT